jgi:serine/threonine protein kinase
MPVTQSDLNFGLSQRYRIVRQLGEGGMGSVFLAEQTSLGNRLVALKVLRRRLLDDPAFLRRLQDEAASTGRIRHQNVVTVHECGQMEDGSPYIAMEFLEGETLGDAMQSRGALPLQEAAEILQQAARGVHAAHKLGIVHRDLKPHNIFLTRDDDGRLLVKILDFGIAKIRESETHTMTGLAFGTPAYMSFEQASGMRGEEIDGRSDVYSLGVVAYEVITGRLPFRADTPMAFLKCHLLESPSPMGSLPPQLEQVVMKALCKERNERFATAPDFAQEFATATVWASETVVVQMPEAPKALSQQEVQASRTPQQADSGKFVSVVTPDGRGVYPLPGARSSTGKIVGVVVAAIALVAAGLAWRVLSPRTGTATAPAVVAPEAASPGSHPTDGHQRSLSFEGDFDSGRALTALFGNYNRKRKSSRVVVKGDSGSEKGDLRVILGSPFSQGGVKNASW